MYATGHTVRSVWIPKGLLIGKKNVSLVCYLCELVQLSLNTACKLEAPADAPHL
jgi:hypothetical protein